MKKLSVLLVLVMLLSCLSVAFAEEPANAADIADQMNASANSEEAAAEKARLEQRCDYATIEADETTGQVKLTYVEALWTFTRIGALIPMPVLPT